MKIFYVCYRVFYCDIVRKYISEILTVVEFLKFKFNHFIHNCLFLIFERLVVKGFNRNFILLLKYVTIFYGPSNFMYNPPNIKVLTDNSTSIFLCKGDDG